MARDWGTLNLHRDGTEVCKHDYNARGRFRPCFDSGVYLSAAKWGGTPRPFDNHNEPTIMTLQIKPIINPGLPADLPADAESLLSEEKIGPRDGAGKTVVVAMSGGVDSAVTALIMRERGYRVIGMNLRLFSPDDPEHAVNPCCGIPAMDDARATCALIGVPFYAINMETEFGQHVVDKFVDEYANGRTPNPCLECNRHVKFRHLVQRARMLGADCLATGHYARVVHGTNGAPHRLYRAVDQRKDQSYVLYTMDQDQLGYITFPLGNLIKPEVRQLARIFGLPVADKEESQEICFVGKGSYADFVAKRRPDVTRPGEIVTTDGDTIGQHQGLVHHTIGQRKGIGVRPAGAALCAAARSGRQPAGGRLALRSGSHPRDRRQRLADPGSLARAADGGHRFGALPGHADAGDRDV